MNKVVPIPGSPGLQALLAPPASKWALIPFSSRNSECEQHWGPINDQLFMNRSFIKSCLAKVIPASVKVQQIENE